MDLTECMHELPLGQCSICSGKTRGPDPAAVAGGLKAAAARAGRVALPPGRFSEEVDAAIAELRAAGQPVNVSAVQRIIRGDGFESGRRPTTAALMARGLLS